MRRASEQAPFQGVRKSRWAAIRNSYPELKSTTIKTWQDWVPDDVAPMRWDAPITSTFTSTLPDGTRIECEVMFISLDRPADVKKLKSLDLTGGWINEASELPKAILDMLTGRVGRYPSKAQGGASWSGIIMDTNSPDDDHWWYDIAEINKPKGYEFFAQPGALLKDGEKYIPNPAAENVKNHILGYEYWLRQIPGKDSQWIKVFVLGEYGSVHDGKPVYPEYNDGLHVNGISPIASITLDIGMDFGLTPAAVITQHDARGRLLVLDELCGEDMGINGFLEDVLIPQLMKVYPEWWAKKETMIRVFGDPAGSQRAQTDEKSCFEEVKAVGLKIRAAKSNAWLPRRGSVAWFLSKLAGGKPMMIIDPCCKVLRKGFNGGYKYRRIQVVGEERFTDEPMKNSYSHPHDALQYVAMESGGLQATKTKPKDTEIRSFEPLDNELGY
ncbi:MAG: TerL [Pseudomonadota bacterium]